LRRAGPVDLVEWAGNVGDAQLVFIENFAGAADLIVAQIGYILAPHAAQLDPTKPEVVRGHRTGMV
jgi:hypothetical protein